MLLIKVAQDIKKNKIILSSQKMSKFYAYSFDHDSSYINCLQELRNRSIPESLLNTPKEEDFIQLLKEVIRIIEKNHNDQRALFKFYTQKQEELQNSSI